MAKRNKSDVDMLLDAAVWMPAAMSAWLFVLVAADGPWTAMRITRLGLCLVLAAVSGLVRKRRAGRGRRMAHEGKRRTRQ